MEDFQVCLEKYWLHISTLVGLPPNSPQPRIHISQLANWAGSAGYNPFKKTIVLPTDWTTSDIIHEAVHHAQNLKKPLGMPPYKKDQSRLKYIIEHITNPYERQARHITRRFLGYRYMIREEILAWIKLK